MRRLKMLLAMLTLVCSCSTLCADEPTKELPWSSVHLNGLHLRLVSPKAKGESRDLYFGNGSLAIDSCTNGFCTGPATVWKIENNRLKTGYESGEGDALVESTPERIVLRSPDGKLSVYSIIPK